MFLFVVSDGHCFRSYGTYESNSGIELQNKVISRYHVVRVIFTKAWQPIRKKYNSHVTDINLALTKEQ